MAAQSFRSDAGHQLNCRYVHVDDEWGINPVKSGFSLTFLNTKHHGNRLNVKEKMNDMSFGIQFPSKTSSTRVLCSLPAEIGPGWFIYKLDSTNFHVETSV